MVLTSVIIKNPYFNCCNSDNVYMSLCSLETRFLSQIWLGLHIIVMMLSIDLLKQILAIDVLTGLKSSLEYCSLKL